MTRIVDDWLRDPLLEDERRLHRFDDLEEAAQKEWEKFHYTTRLKLEGATYSFRMIAGSDSLPANLDDNRGMWEAIRNWHLDAFFFELMSAFDCLLQEVNVRYQMGLPEDKWVTLKNLKQSAKDKGMTLTILSDLEQASKQGQFDRIRKYRNKVTHRTLVLVQEKYILSNRPVTEDVRQSEMLTPDGENTEPLIKSCLGYLDFMIQLVWKTWDRFKQEPEDANGEAH